MRRGSIIGPVILILIGLLFLLNNLRPDLSILSLLSMYWPFLLIGWGVLRLVEILLIARSAKPIPMSGVSGGEWVLVVFLCLIGSGVFLFRHHVGYWSPTNIRLRGIEVFGEPFDYPIGEQKLQTVKTPRVLIENFRGNARIVGADTAEVKVTGRKTVRAFHQNEADSADKASKLELVNQGDLIVVRTNQEQARGDQRVSEDLDITVPKGASIEGRGRYGDFDISELSGNVDIASDNAGVRLQNIDGNVRVNLQKSDIVRAVNVKGTVDLKGRGNNIELENVGGQVVISGVYVGDMQFRNMSKPVRYDGEQTQFRVDAVPGQIRMARGYFNGVNLVGPVQVNARSKDIQISDFTQSLEVTLERGDIELRPGKLPLAKMDVRTRNGDIDLAMPAAAKFALRADVQKGEVTNDFGTVIQTDSAGRGASMRGSVGDGPAIVLNTDRGSVTVRKALGEYASPLNPRQGSMKDTETETDFSNGSKLPKLPPMPKAPPAPPEKLKVERY